MASVVYSQLAQVPTDVMAQILQFLNMSELRGSVKLVSRRFSGEAEAEMLWCLICQNAGVAQVIPSYGSSWRAFAKRMGLMSGDTAMAGNGGWCKLVGYASPTSSDPVSLLAPAPAPPATAADGAPTAAVLATQALPWGCRVLKHGNSEKVSSVGVVYVGGGADAAERSVMELVHLCANVEPRVRPSCEEDVAAPYTPSMSPSPRSDGAAEHDDGAVDSDREPLVPSGPAPRIDYFDICPVLDDQTRFLALRLVDTALPTTLDNDEFTTASRHIARLLEVMWSSCGSLVFVVNPVLSEYDVKRWFDTVGRRLPEASRSESMFCTQHNTPNVTFVSSSVSVQGAKFLPYQLRSWLGYRTSSVTHVNKMTTCVDNILPIPKPYGIPGWVSPLVTPGLTPAFLLEMVKSASIGHPRVDLWSFQAMQRVLQGSSAHTLSFYNKAMMTEIQDRTKGESIPIENAEMVIMHRHFFFSALRSYNLQLSAICGQDLAAGTQLLEVVKRDTNTAFREMWRSNNLSCKQICGTLFHHIFQSATDREVYECTKFNSKNGLRYWTSVLHEKLDVYLSIAKGPRRYEVMAERLSTEVIPAMMSWAASHPDHPHIHPEAVVLLTKELRAKGDKLLMEFRRAQDEVLGKMQRETAIYTTMTGNEWSASCHADNAQVMIQRRAQAERWEVEMLKSEVDLELGDHQLRADTDEEEDDAPQPLPLLRAAEIHSEMAAEGESRAAAARTALDLAPQRSFVKEVSVVSHQREGVFDALRRRLSN